TRLQGDWSSDVCSSDLDERQRAAVGDHELDGGRSRRQFRQGHGRAAVAAAAAAAEDVEEDAGLGALGPRQRLTRLAPGQDADDEIGRASCRERVVIWGV